MHLVGSGDWRIPTDTAVSAAARALARWQSPFTAFEGIRARLVLLALVSSVPLLLLAAVVAVQDVAGARREAQMEALRVAQLQADLIDEHVLAVDTLLRSLSTSVSADRSSAERDAALLQRVLQQLPESYTDVFLSPPTTPGPGLTIRGASTNGVILSRPILDSDGQPKATISAATRLDRLPRLETRDLPSGSLVMILDEQGVVLAHSPDYDAWVGRDLSGTPFVREALQQHQGSSELMSADGVVRLSAYTTATRAPWLVYVGLPSEIVLGSSRVALLRNLWFGVLALGGAVLLAWLIGGRITAPLRNLATDAAAVGRGDLARRTRVETTGEVGVLAGAFNHMAAAVEHYVQDLQASRQREQEARLAAEAAARQIAERERRLQDLVRRLQVAQEDERRRVAYEIHDGLAQVAASAHQHLQTFADYHQPASEGERDALERTVGLVQRTVREARRLIAGLRPTVLDDFGLATAIRLEVEALRGEGWTVTYHEALGDQRLPSQIETALFRVAQEALTNVRKHAGRARVSVTLEHHDEMIQLQVRDWGRGFEPAAQHDRPRPGERVGLLSMHERVALLRGHCTVHSEPGKGTQVIAEVPLPRAVGGGGEGEGDDGAAA